MEIKKEHIKKFRKVAKQLKALMEEINRYNEDANLYAEGSGNLHLMKGPTHDKSWMSIHDNIVADELIPSLSGGSW